MEFFIKAKSVRLTSHIGKFLVADEDEINVQQCHNGSSRKARWVVEFVEGNPHVIRLKGCNGKYLTASDEPFLLGMTGNKVLQTLRNTNNDFTTEWEPIKEGFQVKLRTKGGTFLRANGATPPWRNSITHDLPYTIATQDWIMWDVDAVDISAVQEGMKFFTRAKSVRLQSHLGKYLVADENKETVRQSRNGSSQKARWTVEFVDGKQNRIRLKSCHGLYLTAADEAFLLGMTGKKVLHTLPKKKTDVSIEWEPIKEGPLVKLNSNDGKFLRANGGPPPWRNSVTHDVPYRTATRNWVFWKVDVVNNSDSDSDTSSGSRDTGTPMVGHSDRVGNARS